MSWRRQSLLWNLVAEFEPMCLQIISPGPIGRQNKRTRRKIGIPVE
jgi:hypothetical protein